MKNVENEGVLAKDMPLEDLKALAVQLKLFTAEEVATMKKPAILKAVNIWEEKSIAEHKDKATGLRKLGGKKGPVVAETKEEDLYNGKKVISRTTRELNGKTYEDILVESGETFTDPIAL